MSYPNNNRYHDLNVSQNYSRLFNNRDFISRLITNTKLKLRRQLLITEKQLIVTYLHNINPVIFTGKTHDQVLNFVTNQIVDKINELTTGEEVIDIHEMLKADNDLSIGDAEISPRGNNDVAEITQRVINTQNTTVDIASLLGKTSLNDMVGILNPSISIKSVYILLDTRYRILDNDGTEYYSWNLANNSTSLQQGGVNVSTYIQNIVSMRTFPFRIPYVQAVDDNAYKRVTMYIQEFSAQSVIGHENRNYHFIYKSSTDNRFVDLNVGDLPDNGFFRFRQPIARIETITINFGSPLQPVIFDTDRLYMSISVYSNITTLVSTQPHNLETGDYIYISDFTSANTKYDASIIQAINSIDGTVVQYINDTSFSINIDTSTLLFTGAGNVNVVNGSNTIIGNGTTFTTTFNVGDCISIGGVLYKVDLITSNTSLQIVSDTGYNGVTANNLLYMKNNTISGLTFIVYFGSKRAFIPLELQYLDHLQTTS